MDTSAKRCEQNQELSTYVGEENNSVYYLYHYCLHRFRW